VAELEARVRRRDERIRELMNLKNDFVDRMSEKDREIHNLSVHVVEEVCDYSWMSESHWMQAKAISRDATLMSQNTSFLTDGDVTLPPSVSGVLTSTPIRSRPS
jgi:hypothetical protein